MKRRTLFLIFCLGTAALRAGANEPALLMEARQARAESVPEIAVQKLRNLLGTKDLTAEMKQVATYELALSLYAADELDEAEWRVQPLAVAGDTSAQLLQANIFARGARWTEALPVYQKLIGTSAVTDAAQLGAVECLQALGRIDQAAALLEKYSAAHPDNTGARLRLASLWLDLKKTAQAQKIMAGVVAHNRTDENWKRYLDGRLLLAQDQAAPALEIFDALQGDRQGMTESLYFGAVVGSTEARAILNGFEAADDVLERYISHHGESPYLEEAFRRLDEIYAQEDKASDSELRRWTQKASPHRAALAQYYLAQLYRRAHRTDKALSALDNFLQIHPKDPLLNAVYLLQADLQLERGNLLAAEKALDEAMRRAKSDGERAEIELRTALADYRQGESLLAENWFRRAGQHSARLRVNATFDAALAALNRRNYESFYNDYRELSKLMPNSPLRSDLVLEEGFAQARFGDPRSGDTLELFLHNFPKHSRQNEAQIALAELSFQDGDRVSAGRFLKVVETSNPDNDTAQRAACLEVFLADAATPPDTAKVIDLGQKFVRNFPHSSFLPEVRMKLGQTYFRIGDNANAETQFTLLAREDPNGPYAETALYLAGQSATKWLESGAVDRALRLFDEVVKHDGPLKLYARQQQAIVQNTLGKENEAVTIYDAILTAQPPADAELRFAAMCGKGDSLATLGHKDATQIGAALAVYDSLAAQPDVTPSWRNQALYKKGRVLEDLGREPEALTAFYDVLNKTVNDGGEYFWFYKAGFDAAHIFEQEENWKAAIAIYQKMTRIEGPRAAEAKALLTKLRLEKFIWD